MTLNQMLSQYTCHILILKDFSRPKILPLEITAKYPAKTQVTRYMLIYYETGQGSLFVLYFLMTLLGGGTVKSRGKNYSPPHDPSYNILM